MYILAPGSVTVFNIFPCIIHSNFSVYVGDPFESLNSSSSELTLHHSLDAHSHYPEPSSTIIEVVTVLVSVLTQPEFHGLFCGCPPAIDPQLVEPSLISVLPNTTPSWPPPHCCLNPSLCLFCTPTQGTDCGMAACYICLVSPTTYLLCSQTPKASFTSTLAAGAPFSISLPKEQ